MNLDKINLPIAKKRILSSEGITWRFFLNTFLLGLAFIIILVVLIPGWMRFPQLLYMYRDGEYNLWISLKTAEWSGLYDLTSMNPLQGMTSMLVTINPYFDPGQWVFFSGMPQSIKILASYTIYALEVILSTFALGLTLHFKPLHSFAASIWACLLLFPPFNFYFGLAGWFTVAPMFGHTLALSNTCLITCLNIGNKSNLPKLKRFWKNLLLVGLLTLLITMILVVAPFYNAGVMIGTVLLLSCIVISSQTREQFLWRCFGGLVVIGTLLILGLPEFYASAKAYSARFLVHQPILSINFHNFFNALNKENIAGVWNTLCIWGVYCPPFPNWPISVSALWLNIAIIAGGITAWLTMPLSVARVGILIAACWTALLVMFVLMSLSILSSLVAPVCYFLMMYSLFALYSLYILFLPINIITYRLKRPFSSILLSIYFLFTLGIITFVGIVLYTNPGETIKAIKTEAKIPQTSIMLENRHKLTPIINILQQEAALHPGKSFKGIVATLYGNKNGSLRQVAGVRKTTAVEAGQFEEFLTAAAKETGSSHDLLDLWTWNIPTLSEYGQGLSRPLTFYIIKFLSNPGDAAETHFAFPHAANINILRAMGVRFIIIDAPVSNTNVRLRHKLKAGKHATLYLYELSKPNLGNYSPTRLLPLHNVEEFYQKIKADPELLETTAYVELPDKIDFIPAREVKMIFKKGSIHITAKSKATSTLLLPIQFSHCYKLKGPSSENSKIMRANLIHTLLIFKGNLDINLEWSFRWRHSKCRQQDVIDMNNIGL
ncbi:hypothetical protein [Aquicella lusitana]|uniref:Membrane protein YfhO n=1 Tax=Aquicella lusitana TaxID=254246 RepID=A0A370GY08_9COXI|nr:hypothetical protein [Aquicella lusitana]RDI48140.1 hypothetical protein C8D86_103105 [Aquicella lusitana]VVC72844.1 hypothetical protein AQULUS_05680 [Aquicella lusitana]